MSPPCDLVGFATTLVPTRHHNVIHMQESRQNNVSALLLPALQAPGQFGRKLCLYTQPSVQGELTSEDHFGTRLANKWRSYLALVVSQHVALLGNVALHLCWILATQYIGKC
jgi:hypothetical protein